MLVAVFGGLSPLRGPLATASAEGKNSKAAFDEARAHLGAVFDGEETKAVRNAKPQVSHSCIDRFWHESAGHRPSVSGQYGFCLKACVAPRRESASRPGCSTLRYRGF